MKNSFPQDLSGMKFTMLTPIQFVGSVPGVRGSSWLCKCDCGGEVVARRESLIRGYRKTCGCATNKLKASKHGMTGTPTYAAWNLMIRRCHRPVTEQEARGWRDRGIKVCDRWHEFANFLADMGERPDGLSLDRIDNDGDYEPGNCRWATWKEQGRNKSTNRVIEFDGKAQCVSAWAEELEINEMTLWKRIDAGWPVAKAFTHPVRKQEWRNAQA